MSVARWPHVLRPNARHFDLRFDPQHSSVIGIEMTASVQGHSHSHFEFGSVELYTGMYRSFLGP